MWASTLKAETIKSHSVAQNTQANQLNGAQL